MVKEKNQSWIEVKDKIEKAAFERYKEMAKEAQHKEIKQIMEKQTRINSTLTLATFVLAVAALVNILLSLLSKEGSINIENGGDLIFVVFLAFLILVIILIILKLLFKIFSEE